MKSKPYKMTYQFYLQKKKKGLSYPSPKRVKERTIYDTQVKEAGALTPFYKWNRVQERLGSLLQVQTQGWLQKPPTAHCPSMKIPGVFWNWHHNLAGHLSLPSRKGGQRSYSQGRMREGTGGEVFTGAQYTRSSRRSWPFHPRTARAHGSRRLWSPDVGSTG